MMYCQDVHCYTACYIVDYAIVPKNDLSYFIISTDLWNHSSNPGIILKVLGNIDNFLEGK